MRMSISKRNQRVLARGAALVLLGGLTTGCSSGAMRFSDVTDGLFTGSTANQRAIIHDQPYPGDRQTAAGPAEPVQAAPAHGTVSRSSLPPAGAAPAASPASVAAASAEETPAATARQSKPALDETTTGTVAAAPAPAADETIKGWSRAGGTQITAKDGETVYNLSKRFGVPADIIMKMNGLTKENGLKVGQKIVIPTYVYSAKAGVSSPDSDPRTAEAKSSRGVKEKTPLPAEQPAEKTAVLSNSPKVKEGDKAGERKAADSGGTYTVVAGDSLSKISRKTGVGITALKEANGLGDGTLRIGQVLKLGGKATVAAAKPADAKKTPELDPSTTASVAPAEKKPETGNLAEYTPPRTSKAIEQAAADAPEAEAPDSTGIGRMRWPVTGKVVSGFGRSGGAKNDGIDISVPKGTPVKAAENGVVIYAGDGLKEFGNTVLVRHDNGLVTVYGHASELKVQRGQKVKRGEEIAVSGMSGNAKTPRLHFEVRKDSAPVDPKTFLE